MTIPKLAHYIWMGSDLPAWARKNIEIFQELNPRWEARVWLCEDEWIEAVPQAIRPLIASQADAGSLLPWYSSRSDIVSYALLKKYGGLYMDVDVVPLRPLDDFQHHKAYIGRQPDQRLNCAVMGSEIGSEFACQALAECERRARIRTIKRCTFGPDMLTSLFDKPYQDVVTVLPRHYFYAIPSRQKAHPLMACKTRQDRMDYVYKFRKYFSDDTPPYLAHLWGVDDSSVKRGHGLTRKQATLKTPGRAVELSRRLIDMFGHTQEIRGAEIGVLGGETSAVLLDRIPRLHLYMVDPWLRHHFMCKGKAQVWDKRFMNDSFVRAITHTAFAKDRRTICRTTSKKAAVQIEDESLDFVFIDADHRYEGVLEDLRAWYPKIKPGGLFSGHDIDNPIERADWDVRGAIKTFMPDVEPDVGPDFTWFITKD